MWTRPPIRKVAIRKPPSAMAASTPKAVWMPSMKPAPLVAPSLAPMKIAVVRPSHTEPPAIWNM